MLLKHIPCSLCGSNDIRPLGKPVVSKKMIEMNDEALNTIVVKCNRCGFYYTDPMPFFEKKDIYNFYDDEYFISTSEGFKQRRVQVDLPRRLNAIEQYSSSKIQGFLEVGCGLGLALEEEVEETLTCYHFPSSHRRRIRTTNSLERFNEEIRRRTRVIRIFPNEASCLRLICALCIEKSEEWLTGKRYLKMNELYEGENQITRVDVKDVLVRA